MEYFIFKGINSADMNIVIKVMPALVRANQRINTITLEGRSGSLHEIEDKFDSYNIQIECILMSNANIDNIKKWLIGQGELILSTNSNVKYTATVVNKIDFTKYLTYLKEFPIELELQPVSYSLENKVIEIEENVEKTFTIGGNHKTYPIIKIKGNGSITCNGRTINIKDNENYIYIDCELMNAYYENLNMNKKVNGLENPIFLENGENVITTIGVSASMEYREAWL